MGRNEERRVAPGVVMRSFAEGSSLSGASAVWVLDVDLAQPGLRVGVVADRPTLAQGRVYADGHTVREWCRRAGALAGVNGGFFGHTRGGRQEVIGLLAADGVVHSGGRLVRSSSHQGTRFARCVLGFDAAGAPRIGWAVAARGSHGKLTALPGPVDPVGGEPWEVVSAVACGPRLVEGGRTRVTDREERLMSPPRLWRTFAAYSAEAGRPRHLALAIASAMTFEDASAFAHRYFREYHGTACAEAMCLDGGGSSQMTYRAGERYDEARPSFTSVPTAVLVMGQGR